VQKLLVDAIQIILSSYRLHVPRTEQRDITRAGKSIAMLMSLIITTQWLTQITCPKPWNFGGRRGDVVCATRRLLFPYLRYVMHQSLCEPCLASFVPSLIPGITVPETHHQVP
jgi:hypothetical protein